MNFKYYVNPNNNAVIRIEEGAVVPGHVVRMSQQEVDKYLAWVEEMKKARDEGLPIPEMPRFGPASFEEDAEKVVADAVAEHVEPTPSTLQLASDEEPQSSEAEELLEGLLKDDEDS